MFGAEEIFVETCFVGILAHLGEPISAWKGSASHALLEKELLHMQGPAAGDVEAKVGEPVVELRLLSRGPVLPDATRDAMKATAVRAGISQALVDKLHVEDYSKC